MSKTNEDLACNAQGDERFLPHEVFPFFPFFFLFLSHPVSPSKWRYSYNSSNSYTQVAQSDPIPPSRFLVGAGFVFYNILCPRFFGGRGPDVELPVS